MRSARDESEIILVEEKCKRLKENAELYIETSYGTTIPISITSEKKSTIDNLVGAFLSPTGIQTLVFALELECYRELTYLSLSGTSLNDDGLICILQALQNANGRQLSVLFLLDNNITDKGMAALANAMEAGIFASGTNKNFSGSMISVHHNPFTNYGIEELIRGLTHPNCPKDLTIFSSNEFIDDHAAELLIKMYHSGLCKENLNLDVNCCSKISANAMRAIEHAKFHNQLRYNAERYLALCQGLLQSTSSVSTLRRNLDCLVMIAKYLWPNLENYKDETRQKYVGKEKIFANNLHTFYKNLQLKRQAVQAHEQYDFHL